MVLPVRLISAIQASAVHLILSIATAAATAALVFTVWYPFPYRELMGGRELFFLVVAVDVVCGPLLTLVLYNPKKSRTELKRDLGLVGLIQLGALFYGLYTVMVVRPVYLVYEVDRFSAISAIDVDQNMLDRAKAPWNELPMWGPQVISVREPHDSDEKLKSLDMSLQGLEPSARPGWWQPLEVSREKMLLRAKSVTELRKLHIGKAESLKRIEAAISDSKKTEGELRWLPMTSTRNKDWTAFIDAGTGMPLAYAAVDGF